MPPHILFARFLYNQQDRLHKAAAHYDLLRSRNLSELERLGLQVCAYLCVFGGGARAHAHAAFTARPAASCACRQLATSFLFSYLQYSVIRCWLGHYKLN